MVELDEMADLVRGEIVEHERRGENEPPGEGQHTGVGARAPAARLVAHADALEGDAELVGVTPGRGFEIALRLALEKVVDTAIDVRRLAGHAQEPGGASIGFDP